MLVGQSNCPLPRLWLSFSTELRANSLQYMTTDPFRVRLSCLALKYQLNIAVDMGDLQPCSRWDYDCPKDRRYQFNTAVVFGTDGAIVAKYHKTNLYFEPEFDVPINQHPIEFELFGVKFGVLICFDIMFAKPQIEMLQRYGVTDVIYPTWWVNTPPILTAVQIQQGWSRAFGLNLLASNSGWNRKTSGSGVFSNGIALSSFTNPTLSSQNHLLVHRIPKLAPRAADPNTPKLPNSVRIPTEELEKSDKPLLLSTKVLRTWDVSSAVTESVQIEGIQCTLTYQVAPTSTQPSSPNFTNSTFVLYAAKGYLTPLFPATACGVATCHTEKPSDCITLMQRPQQSLEANSTLFNFFSIKAIYSNTTNLTVYPVSAKHDSVLFSEDELTYIKTSAAVHTLTTPSQLFKSGSSVTVLHAGFLGRDLNTFM